MAAGKRFGQFLVPSIFQGALSIIMLPLITYVLGPKDYGVFALVSAVTAIGVAVSSAGSGYILAAHYPILDVRERQSVVSTLILVGTSVSGLFATIVLLAWAELSQISSVFSAVPTSGLMMAMFGIVISYPWLIATEVLTLERRAYLYAVVLMVQSSVSAISILLGLYVFDLGLVSLFLGVFAGALIAVFGATVALKSYVRLVVSRKWLREMYNLGPLALISNVMEQIYALVERYLLSLSVGLYQLGLYSHAHSYKNLSMVGVNAVGRTIWPRMLEESRSDGDFRDVGIPWTMTQIALTSLGLFFATVGKEFIGLLTHGKFIDAYIWVALLFVILLLQNTGKVQSSILYAHNQGQWLAGLMITSIGVASILLLALVPMVGLLGAIIAMFSQHLLFRVGVQWRAARCRESKFLDIWAVTGMFVIMATVLCVKLFDYGFHARVTFFLVMFFLLAVGARRQVAGLFSLFPVLGGRRSET